MRGSSLAPHASVAGQSQQATPLSPAQMHMLLNKATTGIYRKTKSSIDLFLSGVPFSAATSPVLSDGQQSLDRHLHRNEHAGHSALLSPGAACHAAEWGSSCAE